MASATSSRARSIIDLAELAAEIARIVADRPAPLLVLKIPEFARIAWRRNRRAARRAERRATHSLFAANRRLLRSRDRLAHDLGSDVYAMMLSPARDGRPVQAQDIRFALGRISAAVSLETGLALETGYTLVARLDETHNLSFHCDDALARGARERENEELLATIGHELRTPLTSIRGFLETLRDDAIDAAKRRHFIDVLHRETLRLTRLADEMLGRSGCDGSSNVIARECDLGEQTRAACELLESQARIRGVTIEAAHLEGTVVPVEAGVCAQILLNLLDNAVRHGRERGRVRVGCMQTSKSVSVTVDDDGPGLDWRERQAVFGWHARGARTEAAGCGIGLAIVRTIVERAGGRVLATDSPLGGARFEVRLPRAESHDCAS